MLKIRKYIIGITVLLFLLSWLPGCGPRKAPDAPPPTPVTAVDPRLAAEAEHLFAQGLEFYEQGSYQEAAVTFDKAIAADPANFKIYTAKGLSLCFEGKYKEGIALIQKTLDMNPGYVPAFYDMAMAYKLQEQYDQALYWFEKTIQGDPQNTWSYYGIATIYADRGNVQSALTYLKKAIEIDPAVKEVARQQSHFDGMWNIPEFQSLVR